MNILTFDIEEWFHILDNNSTKSVEDWGKYESRFYSNMDRIFDLLEETNTKATFFCLGWVAEKYPDVIRRINKLGHEIGSHSYAHQLVYEQSPQEYQKDLERSIKFIEDTIGEKVKYYRSPGFSITKHTLWAFDIMQSLGIEVDCSIFPAKRAHGGMNGFKYSEPVILSKTGNSIKAFPMMTQPILGKEVVFSGGGYFRLLPYKTIKNLISKSNYVMTYFHPRDFDAKQPVIKELSLLRKFKSYYGLKRALPKLSSLLKEFEFIDLKEAINQVDWEKVPVVKI